MGIVTAIVSYIRELYYTLLHTVCWLKYIGPIYVYNAFRRVLYCCTSVMYCLNDSEFNTAVFTLQAILAIPAMQQ